MKEMKFRMIILINCLWLGLNGERCPSVYMRYSLFHTYCLPPNLMCRILRNKVGNSDTDVIINLHNAYRSRVARGLEDTDSLPNASNMLEMVWDDELASLAQKHSDQCMFRHDCPECRRVKNFAVGQNLYTRKSSSKPSEPDWAKAVTTWYNEVKHFWKHQIDSFQGGIGPPTTGHFTQVIWANSWRVGCGYSLFRELDKYVELYTCNYGPSGNGKGRRIYKKGETCSGCPLNSCCTGKTCPGRFPGLCKIAGVSPPQYKRSRGSIFYCSFNNEPDCTAGITSGVNKWKISRTLSGSYVGIVLNGGESSTLNFTTPFKVSKKPMCVRTYFRNGPQVAGQLAANTALEIFRVPSSSFTFSSKLQTTSLDFVKFSSELNWAKKTMLSVSFSVPPGLPPQYLELKEIEVKQGQC